MQVVDPVGLGIVATIARPGGNITGFTQGPRILWGKRLDLLSDLIGRRPSRLGWLGNPGNPASTSNWADAKEAADRSGPRSCGPRQAKRARSKARSASCATAMPSSCSGIFSSRWSATGLRSLSTARAFPAAYENRAQALAGGLMSYGGDLRENYHRGAAYVDRVLKQRRADVDNIEIASARTRDRPLKTRALVSISPPTLLARADEVIE